MSAPTTRKAEKKKAPPIVDMDPTELMKGMGGNGWFNPVSNDQVTWPMAESDEQKIPRSIYRMFSWMLFYAVTKGNRHPYANKNGKELHLENMGADLAIEMNNLRTYWRLGVKLGLWRGGTETEGTRRLYLCAKVVPVAEPEPDVDTDEPSKRVCTNPLPTIFQQLRPYMREQIEKLPPEVIQRAATRYARLELVRDVAFAEVVSAVRMVTDQDEDTLWRELGVEKKRQEHKSDLSPEELEARQRRIAAILPHVHGYVQTLDASVQTPQDGVYEASGDSAQTRPPSADSAQQNGKSNGNGKVHENGNTPVTLPVLDKAKRTDKTPGRHSLSVDAGDPAPSKPLPTKGRSSYTHPEDAPTPAAQEAKIRIDDETREGLRTLAEQIEQMQQAYRHTDFGLSDFDPISKPGQQFLLRVMNVIGGPEHVLPYCLFVAGKFKGLDRNALGKQPSRAPGTAKGPRGMGLLLSWAGDYARTLRRGGEADAARVGGD